MYNFFTIFRVPLDLETENLTAALAKLSSPSKAERYQLTLTISHCWRMSVKYLQVATHALDLIQNC